MDIFENISPLDFRYYARKNNIFEKLSPYLSEKASIKYQLKVELALIKALAQEKICQPEIVDEVQDAIKKVTAKDVYEEEDRIHHNIRALVNCIRKHISDKAKPYVHMTATSCDIIYTAESKRYKEFTEKILLTELKKLISTLCNLAEQEKSTIQIGRTHGQHAEPITFGFTISSYISRLLSRIKKIDDTSKNLRGKFSGAVGGYNASSLFFDDPISFEKKVLSYLDLMPAGQSSQIVEAEYMTDYIHSIISCFGVIANIADDMRHLQRSEIYEVAEVFGKKQVGSSTMPHKRNPINFENIKSMYKEFMPRMTTLYLDQISEHQRDLTNSASSRFIPEILAGFYVSITRLNKIMKNLVIDKTALEKNFDQNSQMIIAEPLYILLAANGHPDAHEYIRKKTLESKETGKNLKTLIDEDQNLKKYLEKLSDSQKKILDDPKRYIGSVIQKTEEITKTAKEELGL